MNNNEPVAWITMNGLSYQQTGFNDRPLYTHPHSYQSVKAKTLTDAFIYENHVGYLSPSNDFYAPDYPTWKQDGFTPIYKEPVAKTLTDEEIMEVFTAYEQMQEYGYVGKKPFQVSLGWSLSERNDCLMLARAILKKASEK